MIFPCKTGDIVINEVHGLGAANTMTCEMMSPTKTCAVLFAIALFLVGVENSAHASGFAPPVIYQAGIGPNCVTLADFNFDGFIDVAVTNALSNNVSILLGNGDGTLQSPTNYSVGRSPGCVISIQDRGPGMFPDLAVTNTLDNNVSILLNNGDGTFQPAVNYGLGTGTAPVGLAGIDTTSDGFEDFVVANSSGGSQNAGNVAVLVANGDGTFQAAVNYDTMGTGPLGIVQSSFTPKFSQDFAVINFVSNNVSVFLNNNDGTGKFTLTSVTPVGTNPSGVTGEGNTAGVTSLIVSNSNSNNITYLFGNDAGGFEHTKNYAAGKNPSAIIAADLNLGSVPDLAVTNEGDSTVGVYLGLLHHPGFRKPTTFATCLSPNSIRNADLNLDGNQDVVVACSNGVAVMLNTGP